MLLLMIMLLLNRHTKMWEWTVSMALCESGEAPSVHCHSWFSHVWERPGGVRQSSTSPYSHSSLFAPHTHRNTRGCRKDFYAVLQAQGQCPSACQHSQRHGAPLPAGRHRANLGVSKKLLVTTATGPSGKGQTPFLGKDEWNQRGRFN